MRLALTLATLLLLAFSAGAQAPPIKIGFASAMSGPAAITGEGVRWGATLAVEEINAKGGVMGRKIEAFFADNKAQPGEAVSAVRTLRVEQRRRRSQIGAGVLRRNKVRVAISQGRVLRRLDETLQFMEQIYRREITPDDTCTIVRFSQIIEPPSGQLGNGGTPHRN